MTAADSSASLACVAPLACVAMPSTPAVPAARPPAISALRLSVDFGKSPLHCLHTSHSVGDPDSARYGNAELGVVLRRIDRIARRIRSADRAGRTITLRFRFDAFARATRSHSLPSPTAASATIESVAIALLAAALTMIDDDRRAGPDIARCLVWQSGERVDSANAAPARLAQSWFSKRTDLVLIPN